jgi:hypothetical protein
MRVVLVGWAAGGERQVVVVLLQRLTNESTFSNTRVFADVPQAHKSSQGLG